MKTYTATVVETNVWNVTIKAENDVQAERLALEYSHDPDVCNHREVATMFLMNEDGTVELVKS